ncbi:MAG: hypothetical protein JO321_15125 [Solirubrobacterales bacterium]|nr:hypothetical protein [Solirubrobacterales bacterium]MBV9167763.1 hypothetical protein [Solirubrobacterales bacterium]MBV9536734.1 hypothetical protein [Solirubrobacterales bacterium]
MQRAIQFVTFRRLEVASITHSTVFLALLICAFALGKPEPETFILGMTHGVMWITMSLVCIVAARMRIIPFWLAVTISVLGGLGPFLGSLGFVLIERRRGRGEWPSAPIVTR